MLSVLQDRVKEALSPSLTPERFQDEKVDQVSFRTKGLCAKVLDEKGESYRFLVGARPKAHSSERGVLRKEFGPNRVENSLLTIGAGFALFVRKP